MLSAKRAYAGFSVVLLGALLWSGVAVSVSSVAADDGQASAHDLELAQKKIAVLEAALNNLEAVAAKRQAVVAQLTATGEALKAEVAQLRAQLILFQADRDKAFTSLVEATDALQKVRAENKLLSTESERLRALAAKAGLLPKDADASNPPAEPTVPLAAVEGVVLDVQDGGSVVISIGTDDGLRSGQRLHLYRSLGDHGIYVGQIEIVQAKPDTATCKVVQLQDTVRKGDCVVTRL